MALQERMAIGMPPDGVGKHLNVDYVLEIDYVSGTGSFTVGDHVTGSVTGLHGVVTRALVESGSTGEIFLLMHPEDIGSSYQIGENLLVDSVPIAQVGAIFELFTQRAQIIGGNNPFNAQFVDRQGAASVRFAEGSTQFDGFGRMNVSNLTSIGDYQSHSGLDPDAWNQVVTAGGLITYVPGHAGALLSTSTGGTDRAVLVTQKQHPYQAGTGQLIMVTAYCGDNNKAGVTRRWGYFDDDNGLFFQLKDSQLSFIVRSNVTGSVVEREYLQEDWNYDVFDGTGTSQFNLDVTKHNLYWINFAWLGVGAVRFGAYGDDGARLQAHTVQNGNVRQEPYMANPRLPVRYEIENTTSQGTTTELFGGCAAVMVEGNVDTKRHIPMGGADAPTKTITGSGITPLFGMRSALLHDGIQNKQIALPHTIDVQSFLAGTTTPAQIKLLLVKNPTGLTGQTWVAVPSNSESSLEFEPSSTTTVTDGRTLLANLVFGEKLIDVSEIFDLSADESLSLGTSTVANQYYLCAKPVKPADSIDVTVAVNWSEI